ncbi:MAG: TonB-dependent receptor domain-containing protein [Bacteroidia bacterium]
MMKRIAVLMCFQCLMLWSWAQKVNVTGKITDKSKNPISGASIIEKGTYNGAYSQDDGSFALVCDANNATLVINMFGFTTQEIKPAGRVYLEIVLKEEMLNLSGVEIVGTRNLNRTAIETPVAIEIIPIAQVTSSVGQLDLNQVLQFVSPSFNSNRQSGSDGTDHIDPATLRGLGPDQTLVLINGKRRHQSSLVNIYGARGRGNTGTDLNTIPAAAIERIEILRDGAAAQYGSDAIAGVINIVLKKTTEEFSVNLNTGVTQKLDGESVNLNVNHGFNLGKDGFINVTADYLHRGRTQRDAVDETGTYYRKKFGDAQMNNFSAFFNAEVPLIADAKFYAFGGYNVRMGDAYAWTRDSSDDRNVPALYPNGFDPHILSNIDDKSISVGVRGKISEWNVDFNNTFGNNNFRYLVDGTLNTSLQTKSPTRFDAGGFGQTQNSTGITFSRYWNDKLAGISLALGAEHRIDNYYIFAGEDASWKNYGVIDTIINGLLVPYDKYGYAAGSQGFPGFQPSNELNESRTNLGGFVDAEIDFTKKFTVALAARTERYSDFGNALTGKVAMRYAFTPKFALRASANTGFRAPSLAQKYFNSIYTNVVGGVIQDQYLAKNESNVTRVLGIPALKQERSMSVSAGFTARPMNELTITVDGYWVNITDRIVLTGIFEPDSIDTEWESDLNKLGVVGAQFFTNALDTRTMGLDAIVTYAKMFSFGRIQASFAGNWNNMTLGKITTSEKLKGLEETYFGAREKAFLLASAPPSKLNLTLDYKVKRFNTNLRFVRFGKVELVDWSGLKDVYDPRITTDLAFGYDLSDKANLVIGGNNILNVYPTRQNVDTESGGVWDPVQMGFNGAFWFARLRWKF